MPVNAIINVQDATLPVTIGLPFRQSDNLLATTALRVKAPGGTVIASSGAFEVLARWGGLKTDNTKPIMIALVSFQPAAGVTGNYTVDDSAASFTPAPLTVTNGASTVRVQSSALDVTLNKTAADLIQSFVIGGEQLAAGSKPRLNAVGDASAITTVGLAAAGQNQITVASALGLSVGATIKLKFEGTHAFTQGGAVVLNEFLPFWNGTGLNRQFRMEAGTGNQDDFTLQYIDPANGKAQLFYTVGPTLSHVAGVPVRDQTLEADFVANGAYTINAIAGTTLTLSRNLPVAIYEGTQVAVQGGGGGPVTGAFTPATTIVERQTDNLVTVRQRGNFASSVYPTIEVTMRWHFYAGMPWVRAQLHLNNYSKDTGAPVADVPISSLTFECPTATAASGSDSVTTDAGAIARVQASTSAVTLSAGTFQFGVPEFAEKWPKGITGDSGGFHFQVFPSVVTLGAARATEVEFFIGQSLTAPLTLTKRPTNATLDPAYVVSTGAHRGVTTVAQTWTAAQLNNDTELTEAANRTEQALAVMYDVTKSQTYGAVPQLSAIEWRNRAEYGRQYGWDMFGTFNWGDDPRCYNHYDTQYHTLIQFMRTADMRALAVGSECARFMATYGTYQSRVFDGGNIYNQLQGVARFEDEDRRGPAFLSHSWFEGLWAYWSLTGDQQVYEAALKSIEGADQAGATQPGALMNWRWKPTGTNPYPGAFAGDGASWDIFTLQDGERYLGWSVMGLMAAYRYTGRADVLAMAGQYVSCFTAGEIAQGNHGYYIPVGFEDDNDPPSDQSLRRKVAFVNFGYPLNGVIEYWKQTGDTTVRDYISRVGKCVVYGDAQAGSVRKDAIVQGGFAANGKWFSTDGAYFWWPGAQTTLAAGIANNATSLTLTDGSKFYADGGNIAISEGATTEYVQYTSRTGNTLNGLTRARYGGTAAAFTTAATVAPVPYQNEGVPCSGVAIDYLPVISTAAKITGDSTISDAAKRVFKDVSLYFGILAQPLQTDRFFINLRTYGYPGSSIKNWGQRAFGLEQYLADALANPVPVISSISPTSKTAGDAQFTLTVNGNGFVSGAIVRVGGADRVTTFVGDTQLTATIPASDVASAGTLSITVFNPTPGGGTSNSVTLTVNAAGAPAPTISSLSPSSATAGGAAFTLTVNGSNFVSGAVVRWNGSNRTTTFVSTAQLTAQITLADIADAGSATVTAQNPDNQSSPPATLTVNAMSAPSITSLSPSSTTSGSPLIVVTVAGSGFVNGSKARRDGFERVTAFLSATALRVQFPASDLAQPGTTQISIINPDGQISGTLAFTITPIALRPGLPADKRTITVRQGDTFRFAFQVKLGAAVVSLAGVTGRMQIRPAAADETAQVILNISDGAGIAIDQANHTITLNFTAAQTAGWKWRAARYDLELTSQTGEIVTVLEGDIRVRKEITR